MTQSETTSEKKRATGKKTLDKNTVKEAIPEPKTPAKPKTIKSSPAKKNQRSVQKCAIK